MEERHKDSSPALREREKIMLKFPVNAQTVKIFPQMRLMWRLERREGAVGTRNSRNKAWLGRREIRKIFDFFLFCEKVQLQALVVRM